MDVGRVRTWGTRRGGPWTRGDWAVALVALAAFALRWPQRAKYLMTWDAHTFALALERYDVNALRPHAPGYPVFVALGKLSNALVPDANDAYIALSLAMSAAGVAFTYAIGRRLHSRLLGLAAAILVAAAPLVHMHALTANSYTSDLAASAAVALCALRVREAPTRLRLVVLAVVYGLAVGIRQSLGLFMAPLVAWAALQPPWDLGSQVRRLTPPLVAGAVVGLAWFLPMAHLSGGIGTWRRANASQSGVVFEHPVWQDGLGMLKVNADRMAMYLQWELAIVVPALVGLLAAAAVARAWRRPKVRRASGVPADPRRGAEGLDASPPARRRELAAFLSVWAVPPLLFYLLVYSGYGNGPSGYALILLAPLALAATRAGWWAARQLPRPHAVAPVVALVAVAAVATGLAQHRNDVADVDYIDHDAWADAWSALPSSFPPSNSSIVTAYNFAHVWYYYPDYQAYEYRPPGKAVGEVPDFLLIQHAFQREATPDWYDEVEDRLTPTHHPLANGTKHLVLFDFQLAGENGGERQVRPEVPVREAFLPNGWRLLVVDTTPDRPLLEDYFTLEGALTGTE